MIYEGDVHPLGVPLMIIVKSVVWASGLALIVVWKLGKQCWSSP